MQLITDSENLLKAYINSVRWSPCGNYLATASDDREVKVTEFRSGGVIFKAKTPDNSNRIQSFILIILSPGPAFSVCFI